MFAVGLAAWRASRHVPTPSAIVDKTTEAEHVLSKIHTMVQVRDVIFMDVPNQPGELVKISERLAEAGINIEYAYCTCSTSQKAGALVLARSPE